MYYKIITDYSFFYNTYHDSMDVFNIPAEKVFVAQDTIKHKPQVSRCLINESCFHFAEGAFDTMLWYTRLNHHDTAKTQIYSIQPLTNVQKERCKDELGIYQCGAKKIKFLEKQDINTMFNTAVQEYASNQDKYKNFEIDLDSWKKHKSTCFFMWQDYYEEILCRH